MRHLAAVSLALLVAAAFHVSAQDRPLPDRDAFYSMTQENLVRSQREQVHYAYRERRTDIHVNPFGKIGTDGARVFEVTPASTDGVFYRKLIERDGKPVTDSKPERIEPRRREPSAKRNPVDDALQVLDFRMERRDAIDGRDMIVVGFAPKPDAKAHSRAAALAMQFKGDVWVDEAAHEVARVDAVAIEDLTFGLGLLARINDGTRVTVVRQKVDGTTWLPTSLRFKGDGRAMLVRKLVLDYAVEWYDYRRVN